MALGKIFGRRTHACVFVDVDAAKSVSRGRSWASGFWFQDSGSLYMYKMIILMI